MAQRNIIIVELALISVLVVSLFASVQVFYDAYTIQAQKIFHDAVQKVEQIRNVTLPTNIVLHAITKQQAVDMWGKPSGTSDLTNLYRREKIYKGLFLMAQNDSLYQATTDWTANWAAATISDHEHNSYQIWVIRENWNPFDPTAEGTMIHELTHIWQPNLGSATTFDQLKAQAGLVEGDASFMGDYYKNYTQTQASVSLTNNMMPVYQLLTPLDDSVCPMSNTLWSLDYFPYDQGKTFVTALYTDGGFTTINRAYTDGYKPSSTMQILHPSEYFANVTAQSVDSASSNDSTWNLVQTDLGQNHNTYGEFFIRTMLATWLNKTTSTQVASGWAGDNFTYYEKNSDFLFAWNITWSSVAEASQFSQTFSNMMNQTGASVVSSQEWQAYGRYLTFDLNPSGTSTLIACSTVESAALQSNLT
jgi:hypothetical protein